MRSLRIVLLLAGKHLRILSRMRAILLVIFLPGIVLYSIFTAIFSGPAGRPFKVAVVDLDETPQSRQLIEMLEENNVKVIRRAGGAPDSPLLSVEQARESIRQDGKFRVALVIPEGYGDAPNVLSGERHEGVEIHFDETQRMEAQIVMGMVQMAGGRAMFEEFGSALLPGISSASTQPEDSEHPKGLIRINERSVAINRMQIAAKHTFLAGIVPMFLLFATTGAARTLLEELQSGELRRLLAAPITPTHILLGQQLSSFVLAMVQCYVMYLYAWLVHGVAIWNIPFGLLLITIATSMATTGFGMAMASLCKTCEQLDGIGTVAILAMSAIGGSMVPRWIMPEWMREFGLLTINGWSYDAFMALFQNHGFEVVLIKCAVLVGIAAGLSTLGSLILTRRLKAGPVA